MTIKIESKDGQVSLSLTYATSKKPFQVTMNSDQVLALVRILEAAAKASSFTFSFTLD